jgi:opacity protein-like surface antigen
MSSSSGAKALPIILGCCLMAGSISRAEDTKGKWQFGFGLSYMSTSDSIRSNADVAIADAALGEQGLPPVVFVDPRPDDNVLNEPTIEDDFKFDFSASYGLTRWLALEVWASYMQAPVGNIELFYDDFTNTPGDGTQAQAPQGGTLNECGPTGAGLCWNYSDSPAQIRTNSFVPVGEITQIPIHLSALFRFRPESPLDPYLGAGIGYVFVDIESSPEFREVSRTIAARDLTRVCGGEVSYCGGTSPPGVEVPNAALATLYDPEALTVEVEDAFEWHLVGGVDYYLNERFSIYFDARYSWANGQVDIKSSDFHQVQVTARDEGRLFPATQSIWDEVVGVNPGDPLYGLPYYWEDQGPQANQAFHTRCPECRGSGFFETEDKNGNGLYDDNDRNGDGVPDEDDGVLYVLPPGSMDPNERLGEIFCPSCVNNGNVVNPVSGVRSGPGVIPFPGSPAKPIHYVNTDSEDVNFSRSMDRFLNYGIDICTTPQGVGHPACSTALVDQSFADQYVLPVGCPTSISLITDLVPEGCPAPITGVSSSLVDNESDNYTLQGGEIRYDGFSLGVGIKLTF